MRLITAYLYITLRCNARCGFCRIWREQGNAPPDMTPDVGVPLMNDLRRLGARHVDLTGGEPTMNPYLPELLRHARRAGLITSVTSNGLIYEQRAPHIRGLVDSLGFSLNGPTAEVHDAVQGVRSFDQVLASIRTAWAMGEPVHAHFTATNENMQHLDRTYDLARSLGVPLVVFPEFPYFGNPSLAQEHVERLMSLSRQPGACVNTASLRFLVQDGNDTTRPTCYAGRSSIAISPEGSLMLPCFHHSLREVPTMGDLYGVYRSEAVQRLLRSSGRYGFCEGCTNWCYVNPSFVYRPSRFTLPHVLSGLHSIRAVYSSRWPRAMAEMALRRRG